MNRKKRVKDLLVLSILTAFVIGVLLAFGSDLFTTRVPSHFDQLETGWSVKYGEKEYTDVSISEFNLHGAKRGELVSFTKSIPSQSIKSPTLMFKTKHYVADVFIDGKIIYSFGRQEYQQGKFVPETYNMVTIKDCSSVHQIKMNFVIAEDNVVMGFYPIYIGTKKELITYFFQTHRLSMFIGGFFGIYAAILITLGLYLYMTGRSEKTVVISGVLAVVLGIYSYTYNDIFIFLSDKAKFFTELEYLSMFLLPLVIITFIHVTHPEISPGIQSSFFIINTAMPTVFCATHYTNLTHFPHYIIFFQIVTAIENVVLLPILIKGLRHYYKKNQESGVWSGMGANNYLILGYIILLVFVFLEVVKFDLSYGISRNDFGSLFYRISMLDFGMLGFIICLFVYYFLNSIDHMNESKVKRELEGLAYTDSLTGLMNRAKCTQYAVALEVPYGVVNLDLDRLKKVNDTYGHLEGDKMIKAFADLLTRTITDASLIGRTGGDEFMVIFENPEEGKCEKSIDILQEKIKEFNENQGENAKFTLSASAGYAYSSEIEGKDFKFAYYLADTRMYKMKESHHA